MEVIKEFGNIKKVKTDDNKWGYIDKDDNIIVDARYDYLGDLQSSGFITTKINNLWGIIKLKDGVVTEICDEKYYYISSFKYEYATVQTKDGYNFINTSGEKLFEEDFTEIIQKLSGGFVIVKKDGYFGVVNAPKSVEVIPCNCTSISSFGNKLKVQREVVLA